MMIIQPKNQLMMINKNTCISAKKVLQQIKNDSIKSPENKLTSLQVEFMK